MSYCVNCGVELSPSEHACPLCQTEVNNPRRPYDRKYPKPFPNRLDLFEPQDNRLFNTAIITLLLALPAAICLACDVAYTNSKGWSMLAIGAMAMLWVFIIPPMYFRRHIVLFSTVLDISALLGYLWIVERYAAEGLWFQQLAVPIVILITAVFVLDYFLITKVISGRFKQVAMALATVPILLIGIEICVDIFLEGTFQILWSYFVAIPCLILVLLLLVLDRRERFKETNEKATAYLVLLYDKIVQNVQKYYSYLYV